MGVRNFFFCVGRSISPIGGSKLVVLNGGYQSGVVLNKVNKNYVLNVVISVVVKEMV